MSQEITAFSTRHQAHCLQYLIPHIASTVAHSWGFFCQLLEPLHLSLIFRVRQSCSMKTSRVCCPPLRRCSCLLTYTAFYLRASTDNIKHNASVLLSHQGSDALPAYSLRHPDPALPASKNRYAAALYDSYNPEVLFGEVLLIPEWTQHTPTKEEIRLNGGVPPPPQPMLPTEFVIQLYNPDQQVIVKWKTGSWSSAPYWEFEMPQQSFRQPSTSTLDRIQSDPTASENTPKLGFKWKKDGKLSKDFVCSLSGKSTNPDGSKRKNREPDITIAMFRHFKELTIYEPNLSRVDMEDPKGLEVVLLLGAIVIREVYSSSIRESFNISDAHRSNPLPSAAATEQPPRRHRNHSYSKPSPTPPTQVSAPPRHSAENPRPPPTDPRSQWELDAETARLRKQVEHEQRERQRAEAAETKRVKRMLEEEDRARREKQKAIDRETERLKKIYGRGDTNHSHLSAAAAPAVTAHPPAPVRRPHSAAPATYIAHNLRPQQQQQQQLGSHFHPPGLYGSTTSIAYSPNTATNPPQRPIVPKKSSFWHLGGRRNDEAAAPSSRLTKQRSTIF